MKLPLSMLIAAAGLLAGPTAPGARAQEPPLVWEIVGEPYDESNLYPEGEDLFMAGDTAVYVTGNDGLFVIHPGEDAWTELDPIVFAAAVYVSGAGTLFDIRDGMQRSTDYGQTWTYVLDDVHTLIELPSGALVASQDGYGVARSTDDGVTWTNHGGGTPLFNALFARGFAYAPPSPHRTEGRLVTVGIGGAAYSSDDGVTWAPSNIVSMFGYRGFHVVYSAHDDSLYAMVNGDPGDGGGGTGLVWASADGEVWELRGRVPTGGDESPGQIVAAPDGKLWAIIPGDINGEVFASEDGGRTWASRGGIDGPVLIGNRVRVKSLAVGADCRLWLGTTDAEPGPVGTGAVLRTVEPVVVSSEGGPELGKLGAEIGAAYPNPSSGAVTVPLVLPEAAEVSVAVFDVLGRRVATLVDGEVAAGAHRATLDGSRLATGVYLVVLEAGGRREASKVLVVR